MRRYISNSNSNIYTCYNCHKKFSEDQILLIQVISDHLDAADRYVCKECLNKNYVKCYHEQQHQDYPNPYIDLNDDSSYVQKDGYYYCKHCANNYLQECYFCGSLFDIDNETLYSDYDISQRCCDACFNEHYIICEQCDSVIESGDEIITYNSHDNQICVCEDCKDEFVTECDCCGQQINIFHQDYHQDDNITLCQPCFDRDYFYCDGCESICSNDYWGGQTSDGFYCQACYPYHVRQVVYEEQVDPQELGQNEKYFYDHATKIKPKLKKRLIEQETKEYIGVQLQLQNDNNDADETTNFIQQVSKNRKLICKQDGSLDQACGVQINTFPCTYNYHLKSFGWQQVFKVINEYNMTDTSGAGLHFHISKNNFTNDQLKALDYFVNNCVHTLGAIGGRDFTNNSYCSYEPNKQEDQWGHNHSRYTAVNFKNTNTVQLRFPASTSNYNEFKKRLRMVHNICKVVKLFSFDDLKTLDEKNLTWVFTEVIKEM